MVPSRDWALLRRLCLREAMRVLNHREDAEEAVQEALLRAWRMSDQCRSAPLPWMRQISRNEALRIAARRTRLDRELADQEAYEPLVEDSELARVPLAETVRGALAALTPDDQLLIRLRYTEDLTQPQLATLFNVPEGTVKVRLHRARGRLASMLADD
jgi:RNA polymerase sigma-70 factor (ECF subfamily)